MTLGHLVVAKAGFLELAIHVAGEDECPMIHEQGKVAQDGEAFMRKSFPVALQSVAIEPPSKGRVAAKGAGAGDGLKIDAGLSQGRVGFPEAFGAPEIRKSRIDTHAGTSRYEKPIRAIDDIGCNLNVF